MEAAFKALDGIPIGLLKRGCEAAMQNADHPAKIVPAIMAEVREAWATRRKLANDRRPDPVQQLPAPDRCTPEEAQEIMRQFGLTSRFASTRNDAA